MYFMGKNLGKKNSYKYTFTPAIALDKAMLDVRSLNYDFNR